MFLSYIETFNICSHHCVIFMILIEGAKAASAENRQPVSVIGEISVSLIKTTPLFSLRLGLLASGVERRPCLEAPAPAAGHGQALHHGQAEPPARHLHAGRREALQRLPQQAADGTPAVPVLRARRPARARERRQRQIRKSPESLDSQVYVSKGTECNGELKPDVP